MEKLTPNELAFIALANEYCHALEHANECETRDQFVAQMLKLLPRLYITVNDIEDDNDRRQITEATVMITPDELNDPVITANEIPFSLFNFFTIFSTNFFP